MAATKKVSMQVDVSFISNAKALVKQLQTELTQMDIGKTLSRAGVNLTKNLTNQLNLLEKQLNTPGRTKNQYTKIFEDTSVEIIKTLQKFKNLKAEFSTLYSSKANQQNLRTLDQLKKKYEELDKLAAKQQARNKYQTNSINKLEAATNSTYGGANITQFKAIYRRYQESGNDSNFTAKQKELLGIYDAQGKILDGQEESLKSIIKYIEQIIKHEKESTILGLTTKSITGNTTSAEAGKNAVGKQISNLLGETVTPENLAKLGENAKTFAKYAGGAVAELRKGGPAIQDADEKARSLTSTMSTLRDVAAQFGLVWTSAQIAGKFRDLIRYSFDFYKSLDSALNQIYVVSNLSSDAVNNLTGNFINMAERTGMAIDDITKAAVLFYQQGLNTSEVMTMTEVTAQFAKVAGTDAADAANKLTAAVNGYRLAAEDASSVADKFNKVAAASAADIDELSTAFSKAAAQANQAGVSMDNYLAYIATMEEATREAPENLGTSLKTIFSRMQQIKTGDNTEDNVDVNQVETALKAVNIALRDSNGQLRDLEEIFAELGPKWNQLDRNTQAYLGTIIAGTRQQSRFITLMQNWDRVLDLAAQSENSAGMQALMHAKAMESVVSKTQQFKVAWQEFISNLTSSDAIKGLIDQATKLLKTFNSGRAPVITITTLLGILGTRLHNIKGTIGDVVNGFKKWQTVMSSGGGMGAIGLSAAQLQNQLGTLNKAYEDEVNNYNNLQQQFAIMSNQEEQNADALNALSTAMDASIDKQTRLGAAIDLTNAQLEAHAKAINTVVAIANTLITVTTLIVSAFDAVDTKAGGAAMGFIQIAAAVGIFVAAWKLADKAIMSTGIGAILSGIALGVSGLITVIQAFSKSAEEVKKQSLTDALESLSETLDKMQAQSAGIRSAERLTARYKELANQLYKTTAQQEEMNNIAQELGDSFDNIDVITDSFGNMTINIREVEDEIENLQTELVELQEEMKEIETSGLLDAVKGGNSVDEYLDAVYSRYSADYKSIIQNIVDNNNIVADNIVEAINSNLKNNLLNYARSLNVTNLSDFINTFNTQIATALSQELRSGSTGYDKLFGLVKELQENIDDMTFNQVQAREEQFFKDFGERLGITQEQWNVLVNSINTTVFGNDSLISFLNQIQDIIDTLDGSKWTNSETGLLQSKRNEMSSILGKNVDLDWATAHGNVQSFQIIGDDADYDKVIKQIEKLTDKGKTAKQVVKALNKEFGTEKWETSTGFGLFQAPWLHASNEGEAVLDQQQQAIQEYMDLYEDYKKAREQFKKDNNLTGWTNEDLDNFEKSLGIFKEALGSMDTETANFIALNSEIMNFKNLGKGEFQDFSNALLALSGDLENFSTDAERYAYLQENLMDAVTKENPNITKEAKEKIQNMLDEWFSDLQVTADISWSQFANEIKSIGEELATVDGIIEDLGEDGHITLDSFLKLGDVLTNLVQRSKELGAMGELQNLTNILSNLNVAYDENAKALTVNGEAIENLAQLETVLAKAKLAELQQTIDTNLMEAEAERIALESEMEATKALIEWLDFKGEAEVNAAQVTKQANDYMTRSMADDASDIQNIYQQMTGDAKSFATASVEYIAQVADALNKLSKGELIDYQAVQNQLNKIQSGIKWGGLTRLGIDDDRNITYKASDLKKRVESYYNALSNQLQVVNNSIEYYKSMKITIDSLMAADDLGGLFGGTGAKDGAEALQLYIGKLKEIYNILNRIQVLEHRLGVLDEYQDITRGEGSGELIKERLELNQELMNQYKFLTQEQKRFANGYAEFIQSVDGLEDVFDFDKYGQIIINWEKYNALTREAAKGQVSLKEKADDVYETYTNMFSDLQGYFDKMIDYLKAVIKLTEEVIESYVTIEEKTADAIKEIYQEILDTRLEAIDKEKEAIEELRKERERANKEQKDSKEVAGIQSDIQRALMDTSGASASALIKAQNRLDEKLSSIAEDKYSEMIDNVLNKLDEEKEFLQDEFDQMFSNLKWLYLDIEDNLMNDRDGIKAILTQTQSWAESAPIRQQQYLQEWDTYMDKYIDVLGDGKSIYDLWDDLQKTREEVTAIDATIADNVAQYGSEITRTIQKWEEKLDNYNSSITSAIGGLGSRIAGLENRITQQENTKTTTPREAAEAYTAGGGGYSKGGGGAGSLGSGGSGGSDITLGADPTSFKSVRSYLYNASTNTMQVGFNRTAAEIGKFNSRQSKTIGGVKYWYNSSLGVWFREQDLKKYAGGGFADFAGPAWLDGSPQQPEAVLNALQTKHFIDFTNTLDRMYGEQAGAMSNSIVIDTISFNVDSMSSPEDGERAFSAFVDKFNEIGSQTGIKFNNFKNTL